MEVGSGAPLHVTCSIGQAVFPFADLGPSASNWEDILGLADRALYFAKNHGRNLSIGIAPGDAFGSLQSFSTLLDTDLEEACGRGWIRFLQEADSAEKALSRAS